MSSGSFEKWVLDSETIQLASRVRDAHERAYVRSTSAVEIVVRSQECGSANNNGDEEDDAIPIPEDSEAHQISVITQSAWRGRPCDDQCAEYAARAENLSEKGTICGFKIITVLSAKNHEPFIQLQLRAARKIVAHLYSSQEATPSFSRP